MIGNDQSSCVSGIGSVKIKMHDGVVRTLTEVRHVPDMSKNLISLTTLDLGGCQFVGGDGVLKVVKGALVVMKAHQVGILYVLQGSTVIGTAAVSSSMSDSEVTRLWHMRLGHMSEKGLTLVSKSVGSVEWYRKNSLIVVWAYQEVGDLIAKESHLLLMLL